MLSTDYETRRGALKSYFDGTANEAWSRLTSDAPVSGIRQTVRAGRDAMRETLLAMLPQDLAGARVLDAGCGTGALAVELARRGADVVAVDLSPKLIEIAKERLPSDLGLGRIVFVSGDMLADYDVFDATVAMDSLIHYETPDLVRALEVLSQRTTMQIAFTYAPRTTGLTLMHAAGKLFPRGDRSPAIVPVREAAIRSAIAKSALMTGWGIGDAHRVTSGFYISSAMEVSRG
ncbi:MAG: magnesium protoporphyrin IX methyltransferase [Pseudomonadota bacterium]